MRNLEVELWQAIHDGCKNTYVFFIYLSTHTISLHRDVRGDGHLIDEIEDYVQCRLLAAKRAATEQTPPA